MMKKVALCFLWLILLCLPLAGCREDTQTVLTPEAEQAAAQPERQLFSGERLLLDYRLQSSDLYPTGTPAQVAYDDSFFNSLGGAADSDLALLSVTLVNTIANGQEDALLAKMGFTLLARENTQAQLEGDHVAYTIASRQLNGADGEVYTVYSLVLRGTKDQAEWLSNMNVGESGDVHAGWQAAADQVLDTLADCVTSDPAHSLIWLTGHSRGAAAAALVTAALNESQLYAAREQIGAYLFACPAYTLAPQAADNIFNYLLPTDPAAFSFFSVWGYGRHGQDIVLPESAREQAGAWYQAYTGEAYQGDLDWQRLNELLLAWCPDRDSYYSPADDSPHQRLLTLLPGLLSGDLDATSLVGMVLQNRVSGQELACGRFLLLHFTQVLHSHDSMAYVCWLNAAYGAGSAL